MNEVKIVSTHGDVDKTLSSLLHICIAHIRRRCNVEVNVKEKKDRLRPGLAGRVHLQQATSEMWNVKQMESEDENVK